MCISAFQLVFLLELLGEHFEIDWGRVVKVRKNSVFRINSLINIFIVKYC